jgi:hypothetical protein
MMPTEVLTEVEPVSAEVDHAIPDPPTVETKSTGISALLGPERPRTYSDESF